MTATQTTKLRLTELAHGGGCGCKLSPDVLRNLIAQDPAAAFPQLLVGNGSNDDAAVWRLDDGTCIIATTDFFMPMVDDPRDFGRIAATNALSDIYAMGGTPIMALALLGMPLGKVSLEDARRILDGGAEVCAAAGIPVAGGHSIDSAEPMYGLVAIGTAPDAGVRRNDSARPGDALILTKAIGVGLYSAAYRRHLLSAADYEEMIASMTLLNKVGAVLAQHGAVHAMTDVTGFGLAGHALEMARGSGVTLRIAADRLPLLARAEELASGGIVTGASARNWKSFDGAVTLAHDLPGAWRDIVSDPQTSGGLLVAVSPEKAEEIVRSLGADGYAASVVIGSVEPGAGEVLFE